LLTGEWAHASGMLGLHHRGFRLHHPERHLAAYLAGQGYLTAQVGVNHVAAELAEIGYQHPIKAEADHATAIGDAAAGFLRSRPQQPFFLDVGFVETHRGRFPQRDPRDDPRHLQPPAGLPDHPTVREDFATFASAARLFDTGCARVLAALEETGLMDTTLVICTTDHGISFPRHKCSLYDGGLGVMLMIRGPATASMPHGWPVRGTCDALVSQVDIYPTVCAYLGIEPPPWLVGSSLLPLIRGERREIRQELFAEVTYHAAYEPMRAIRTSRHKYIRRFGDRLAPVLSNLDDGPTKRLLMDAGLSELQYPREELYDLVFDPQERNNLAGEPAFAPLRARLSDHLRQWMEESHDPLLQGDVPLPTGAFCSDPDDESPKDVLSRRAVD
jgi:arylsulfatase A-like enzyme